MSCLQRERQREAVALASILQESKLPKRRGEASDTELAITNSLHRAAIRGL